MSLSRRLSQCLFALFLAAGVWAVFAAAPRAQAQTKVAVYVRYVVDFEVQADGRVRVTEDQTVDFRSGSFKKGFVALNTEGASGIDILEVGEPDRPYREDSGQAPYTYAVQRDGGTVTVTWYFPEASRTQKRFIVSYMLDGALRFYPGGDQFWWKAIRPDRPAIQDAVVTVALPSGVPTITLAAGYRLPENVELPEERVDDRTMRLRVRDVPQGTTIEARVQWPHGAVAGTPSAFQKNFDVSRSAEQAQIDAGRTGDVPALSDPQKALFNLLVALLAVLILLGGLFGIYMLWYSRGRDAPVTLPTDYLAEPPSDLPPGVAGTLLDERADLQDVLATLIDLARRGEVRMQEQVEKTLGGLFENRDFNFQHTPTGQPLADYEQRLMTAVFPDNETRRLSELREHFYASLPKIYESLYKATVEEGLFPERPDATRTRYTLFGVAGLFVTMLTACGTIALALAVPAALLIPVAVGGVAVATLVVAQYMPRKTAAGSEAAARWVAFKRYLQDIEKYRDLNEAKDIFDKYLPYAVAFGLDREWIRKFTQVNAEVPGWYDPYPYGGRGGPIFWDTPSGGSGGGAAGAGVPGGGGGPDLQRSSESMGRGLQSMSVGFSTLLNSAAAAMISTPAQSGGGGGSWGGGGWSGGGFSGGGGGGGGGGGFG